jgi:hypothetical protein
MGRSLQVGHDNLLTILVSSAPLLGTNSLDAYEQSRDKEAPRTGRLDSRPHIGITPRL